MSMIEILKAVQENPGIDRGTLVNKLGIDLSTVTKQIGKLAWRKELVRVYEGKILRLYPKEGT